MKKLKKNIKAVRRRELTLRIVKYALMTIIVFGLFGWTLIRVMGNKINIEKASVDPAGLVEYGSAPTGATVTLDGGSLGLRTNNESTVNVGEHDLKYSLSGYRDWTKHFSLAQSQVLWLNYALMIPNKISSDDVANFSGSIKDAVATRDKKFLLVEYDGFNKFALVSIDNPTNIAVNDFSIPAGSLTATDAGAAESITLVASDPKSSRYFLVRHDYVAAGAPAHEFLFIDRENLRNVFNITRDFAVTINSIQFSNTDDREFYAILADGTLRLLNDNDQSISTPIVEKAKWFSQYDTKIVTVTTERNSDENALGIYYHNQYYKIEDFSKDANVSGYYTNYFGKDYLYYSDGASLWLMTNPLSSNGRSVVSLDLKIKKGAGIDWIKANGEGRIFYAYAGGKLYSYDQELKTAHSVVAPTTVGLLANFQLAWTDLASKKNYISDYDGANTYDLGVDASRILLVTNDNHYLFALGSSGDKTVLRRMNLIASGK
jgi:hypothetical protein